MSLFHCTFNIRVYTMLQQKFFSATFLTILIINSEYLKQFATNQIIDGTETNSEVKNFDIELDMPENTRATQDNDSSELKPANNASENKQQMLFGRLDIRIGQMISVEKHSNADSLYVTKVDFGNGTIKTVVSGLVQHVPIEEMQNRKGVFLCNIKPMKVRGVLSEAMLLCGVNETKTEILEPPEQAVPGDIITCQSIERNPDAMLNPKRKIFEKVLPELRINEGGVATYRNVPLIVPWKGVMKVPTLTEAKIK